jgi:hypothetical protein
MTPPTRSRRMFLAFAGLGVAAATAGAQPVIWDELSQGDLSNDRFHPTALAPPPGVSQLVGAMDGEVNGIVDRDYFSITIPQGYVLSQLILEQYFSNDPVAFIGIQPGPIFPDDPATVMPGDLLGWLHFGDGYVGMDLLPLMGANGQGFAPPLTGSVYTFWAQQTGEPTTYVLDFVVTVPAPSVVLPFALIALRRRTRR